MENSHLPDVHFALRLNDVYPLAIILSRLCGITILLFIDFARWDLFAGYMFSYPIQLDSRLSLYLGLNPPASL